MANRVAIVRRPLVSQLAIGAAVMAVCAACNTRETGETMDPKQKAAIEATLRAFENRQRYSTLTIDILKKIPDASLDQALLDFVDCKLSKTRVAEREAFRALSPGFRATYSTWKVEAEVNNGGFNQFFWNSSAEYAAEAVAGFELMGAAQYARLMQRAISIHDAERSKMQALKARGTAEAFVESYKLTQLNELDDEFHKLGGNLSQMRINFVRSRPEMFVDVCEAG